MVTSALNGMPTGCRYMRSSSFQSSSALETHEMTGQESQHFTTTLSLVGVLEAKSPNLNDGVNQMPDVSHDYDVVYTKHYM